MLAKFMLCVFYVIKYKKLPFSTMDVIIKTVCVLMVLRLGGTVGIFFIFLFGDMGPALFIHLEVKHFGQ